MLFKCSSCGGNIVYNPDKGKMVCPHCENEETQQKVTGEGENYVSTEKCINCGAPLEVKEFTSASKCPYCNSFLVYDERVQGIFTPKKIIPFAFGKQKAKDIMEASFGKKPFTPSNFLNAKTVENIEGTYVPFFMYDLHAHGNFVGEGRKVKRWVSGNTEYTETSFYNVVREVETDFDDVPVDASDMMPDTTMDLMEPYDYSKFQGFEEQLLSGFYSEKYNQDANALYPRAGKKAEEDTKSIIRESITGYDGGITTQQENVSVTRKGEDYALLPVWKYDYTYRNKTYSYFINGQTGKLVGEVPVAKGKVIAYGFTVWGLLTLAMFMLSQII